MIDLIFDILPLVHGGGQEGFSPAKGLASFLVFMESLTSMTATEIFAAFLPGMTRLPNIHPIFVHFPIALLTLFFIADLLGSLFAKLEWRKFASGALYSGTFFSLLTVIAGYQAAHSIPHNDMVHTIMLRHQAFGISVTVLAFILSLRRYFSADTFLASKTLGHLSLSALLVILLTLGADLGGLMVYQYGAAVTPSLSEKNLILHDSLTPPSHNHDHSAHTHHHSGHSH